MDILSRFTNLDSSSPFLSEKTVRMWYVVVSSDQVFSSENLEIYHPCTTSLHTNKKNRKKYGMKVCGSYDEQSKDDKLN